MEPNIVLTTELEDRCKVRLQNDVAELETFARVHPERVVVSYHQFGSRVLTVSVVYPAVRVPFSDPTTGVVSINTVQVNAEIDLTGSEFPYPFGAPQVRLRFPASQLVPYIGGLYWANGHDLGSDLLMLVAQINNLSLGTLKGIGIPCLYRHWHFDYTLRWLVVQIHRLLTLDPGTMTSPGDALNPIAAKFWISQHEFALPLEPALDELVPSQLTVTTSRLRLHRVPVASSAN